MYWTPKLWQGTEGTTASFLWCKWDWLWSCVLPATSQHTRSSAFGICGWKRQSSTPQTDYNAMDRIDYSHISSTYGEDVNLRATFTTRKISVLDLQHFSLKYIKHENERFKIFVASGVSAIREVSDVKQWRHITSITYIHTYKNKGNPPPLTPDLLRCKCWSLEKSTGHAPKIRAIVVQFDPWTNYDLSRCTWDKERKSNSQYNNERTTQQHQFPKLFFLILAPTYKGSCLAFKTQEIASKYVSWKKTNY